MSRTRGWWPSVCGCPSASEPAKVDAWDDHDSDQSDEPGQFLGPAGRLEPPGLPGDPVAVVAREARRHPDVSLLLKWPFRLYLVSHPDHAKDVLVTHSEEMALGPVRRWMKLALGQGLLTSEGGLHLRQRRAVQPGFHRDRVRAYACTMVRYASEHAARWRDGDVIDAAGEMRELTLRIVLRTLFGSQPPTDVEEVRRATNTMEEYLSARARSPLGSLFHLLPTPGRARFRRALDLVDAAIHRIMDDRRAVPGDTGDLLSMLLEAQDGETGESMSSQQVRDEAVTLIAAGHETTAHALAWTFYLLSRSPEAEAKLHAEVDSVLGANPAVVDDLPKLEHTERVLTEAMRLYPPSWANLRRARKPVRIGGHQVARGAYILLSQYATHRDERWFPDPDAFLPDRWTPEFRASLPRYAYFPFGAGPRQCVGEPFAWMEGVLVLATIARDWSLRNRGERPVKPEGLITLRPRGGMPMVLRRRR